MKQDSAGNNRSLLSFLKAGVIYRIAFGLTFITITLIMIIDLTLHIIPNEEEKIRALREISSLQIASAINSVINGENAEEHLPETLDNIIEKNKEIESIGVRHSSGNLIYGTNGHKKNWQSPADGKSTLTNVVIELISQDKQWGVIEILYKKDAKSSGLYLITSPLAILITSIGSVGFLLYYLFLKRVLQHLDPKSAIPDRVRRAFNVLSEGLLVLDAHGRVMLANDAITRMCPHGGNSLVMWQPVRKISWLSAALNGPEQQVWQQAMEQQEPIIGVEATLLNDAGGPRHVLINCSAIRDGKGKAKGCLITVNDVTELRDVIQQLNESKEKIELQNKELQLVAHYDPMTGIMNRRAFFEKAGEKWREMVDASAPISVLITDIDKFKLVNDTYGHSVGDVVIQTVARILSESVRPSDILCRYGGEEFCVVLPYTAEKEALEVADRLRARIEREAGPAVDVPGIRITSSFGVCCSIATVKADLKLLIESADLGLYEAKEAGRNCVRLSAKKP